MAATTLAALVAQAQTDIPIIQADIAARQVQLDTARQAVADNDNAISALHTQLQERRTILKVAQVVTGALSLDPIVP